MVRVITTNLNKYVLMRTQNILAENQNLSMVQSKKKKINPLLTQVEKPSPLWLSTGGAY